jgi:hypothetical protein
MQLLHSLFSFCVWELLTWSFERRDVGEDGITNFAENVTSLTHALVTIALCYWILWADPGNTELDHMYGHSDSAMVLFASSGGYFAWELLTTLSSKNKVEWPFVLHAVVGTLCYMFAQYPYLHYYGVRFLLFELSTPFLNMMRLLPGSLYMPKLFVYTFVACRILYGVPLSYFFWQESIELLRSGTQHSAFVVVFCLLANIALNFLNFFWLCSIYYRIVGENKSKSKRNEQ